MIFSFVFVFTSYIRWLKFEYVCVFLYIGSPRRFASVTGDTDCFWTHRAKYKGFPFPPNSGKYYYYCCCYDISSLVLTIFYPRFSQSLPEMMGELFQPHEMPEPPKQSFFIGLFGVGSRSLDREELCMIMFYYY